MVQSESEDELIDRVVDMVMRGEDPDVEKLIASTPDMTPATREKLRKVAQAFGPTRLTAPVLLPREPTLPFAELGPYKILSRMGEGGMGMVYVAEHVFLKRRVALKIIRPELAFSESTRQRFHREAMSIAKLRHENIVSVYDAGEHNGVAFLVMELVEGQGLDELLKTAREAGERMSVINAVRHARGIARALSCAHEAGIIHRDVKPANVRITPDGRELLLDFGLSLADEMVSATSVGQFRGTPQYASPEQIESESSELDARTDVYSLGVTLYECLTGRAPYVGTNMTKLFHQILTVEPTEPRKLNEAVDEVLNKIVMRAIAKRREDRFSNASDMTRALDEWLQAVERPTPIERPAPTGLRKSVVAAVVLALGIAAWLVFREGKGSDGASAAALQRSSPGTSESQSEAQPVVLSTPRKTTALFGGPGIAFNQRLDGWDALVGGGSFGADDEGSGVLGISRDGISLRPHALPGGNGRVSGRMEPIPSKPGERTVGAGAGIEFSNGRVVALFLISANEGYDIRACELERDAESRWVRATELESGKARHKVGEPLVFHLSWNDMDTQFEWDDAATAASSGRISIPRRVRGTSQPSRFLLIVETGSARFEGLVLEEF